MLRDAQLSKCIGCGITYPSVVKLICLITYDSGRYVTPLEDFIIFVYCCVADIYPQIVDFPLRHRGFEPKLTDSEVIIMEIVGEF